MRTSVKVALIAGGYVAAFLIASGAVAAHVAATSGPDRNGSSGMYAFGDSILFLAVFTVASVPPTGGALFALRSYPGFWRALCVLSLAIAVTALTSAIAFQAGRSAASGSFLRTWSDLSPLRLIVAPMLAPLFGIAGIAAPERRFRLALFTAAAIESTAFAYGALALVLGR